MQSCSPELVSITTISARLRVKRSTFENWAWGRTNTTPPFPEPLVHAGPRRPALWDWTVVSIWAEGAAAMVAAHQLPDGFEEEPRRREREKLPPGHEKSYGDAIKRRRRRAGEAVAAIADSAARKPASGMAFDRRAFDPDKARERAAGAI